MFQNVQSLTLVIKHASTWKKWDGCGLEVIKGKILNKNSCLEHIWITTYFGLSHKILPIFDMFILYWWRIWYFKPSVPLYLSGKKHELEATNTKNCIKMSCSKLKKTDPNHHRKKNRPISPILHLCTHPKKFPQNFALSVKLAHLTCFARLPPPTMDDSSVHVTITTVLRIALDVSQ